MPLGASRFGLLGGVADLGKLELIQTIPFSSSVSSVEATNLDESNFNVHFITFHNFSITTAGSGTSQTNFQLAESGTFTTSGYQRAVQGGNANATQFEGKSTSDTRIFNAYSTTSGADIDFNLYMYIYNAGDSSKYTFITTHFTKVEGGLYQYQFGSGVLKQTSTVTGVRAIESNGTNFNNFQVSVYGIKES